MNFTLAKPWRAWVWNTATGRIEEYNSVDHTWVAVPEDGFVAKMLYNEDGTRQVQHGMDYYYEMETRLGVIQGTAMPREDLARRYPRAVVKRGMWLPDHVYESVMVQVHESEAPRGR